MADNGYIGPKFTINPFEAYQIAFGYRAVPYPIAVAGAIQQNIAKANNLVDRNKKYENAPVEQLSKLGAILFKANDRGQEAFCPVIINYKGKKFELPYSTIAMSMTKNIVETPMIGRRGSVKELVQIEDYQFTINGVILGSTDQESENYYLPQDQLSELNDIFLINEPVKLENAFTEIFMQGDNTVVIKAIDLPDMKGIQGAQAYSIRVSSDSILVLEE